MRLLIKKDMSLLCHYDGYDVTLCAPNSPENGLWTEIMLSIRHFYSI